MKTYREVKCSERNPTEDCIAHVIGEEDSNGSRMHESACFTDGKWDEDYYTIEYWLEEVEPTTLEWITDDYIWSIADAACAENVDISWDDYVDGFKACLLLRLEREEELLKQFGEFMWECSASEGERDIAIGYDENGKANSVSLEIYGRTHSEFKFTPPIKS